ncbi:hypothetical protein [Actinomadura formosensis]|uniref:hypothetical protein n=1 Tax=Actinomadura formosensis TaxID=60706 RepID=UPI000836427D|nr:hypothetical protein [Actinomadura formosensis]
MPTITADHLHALLASSDRGAALVVVEGRAAVVPADPGRGDGPEEALMITTREAVIAELDTGANEERIEALAQRLDVALQSLGG